MKFRVFSDEAMLVINHIGRADFTKLTHAERRGFIEREVNMFYNLLQSEMMAKKAFPKPWVKRREELSFFYNFYFAADEVKKVNSEEFAWIMISNWFKQLYDGTAWKNAMLVKFGLRYGLIILNKDEVDSLIANEVLMHRALPKFSMQ